MCIPSFGKILYLEIHVFRNIFIFIIVLKKKMHPHAKAISILKKSLSMVELADTLLKSERKHYRS